MKKLANPNRVIPYFFFVVLFLWCFTPDFSGMRPIRAAGEHENVDDFNVHPQSGRWNETTDDGITDTCANGMFKLTDTGDGTNDQYEMSRKLRDRSGTIEIEWLYDCDAGATTSDTLNWYFLHDDDLNDYIRLYISNWDSGSSPGDVRIYYYSSGGSLLYVSWTTAQRAKLVEGKWYRWIVHYDIQRSKIDIQLRDIDNILHVRYEEGDLWDQTKASTSLSYFQNIYTKMGVNWRTSGVDFELHHNYWLAPFDERNWDHSHEGTDSDWLAKSTWETARVQDDISSEYQEWRLNVPRLDRVSGIMVISPNDMDNFGGTDECYMSFRIYCVDGDDGGYVSNPALQFMLDLYKSAGVKYVLFTIKVDGVTVYTETEAPAKDGLVALQFIVSAKEDRSLLTYEVLGKWDVDDEEDQHLWIGEVEVSDVATDPSEEFVLETHYYVDVDDAGNDDTVVDMFIDDWELVDSFIFTALIMIGVGFAIGSILEATTGSAGIFQPFIDIFNGLLDGIAFLLSPITSWLADFIPDFFDWLFGLVGDMIDWLLDLFFWLYDLPGVMPDFLAILEILIDNFFDLVQGIPALISDFMEWVDLLALIILCLWWFYVVFLQFAAAGFNPLEGTGNMLEAMFGSAIHLVVIDVPQFILMIPLTYFMIISGSGSVMVIW